MFTTALHPTTDRSLPQTSERGFLVLSMSKRVLHVNETAGAFIRVLSGKEAAAFTAGGTWLLPEFLDEVFQAVLAELEKRIAAEDWRQFEMRTLYPASQGLLVARGFGLPDATRRQQSRIVIMLQQEPL
jgi:hypothetical protein